MSLSKPIDADAAAICAQPRNTDQCRHAHNIFFKYADEIAKESGKPTPFDRRRKLLGFHISYPQYDTTTKTASTVKCGNHGCGTLGLFEVEELYIINGSNGGSFRLRVAKTSGGAIAAFTVMMAVLVTLIVLLVVWGVQTSKNRHNQNNESHGHGG